MNINDLMLFGAILVFVVVCAWLNLKSHSGVTKFISFILCWLGIGVLAYMLVIPVIEFIKQ